MDAINGNGPNDQSRSNGKGDGHRHQKVNSESPAKQDKSGNKNKSSAKRKGATLCSQNSGFLRSPSSSVSLSQNLITNPNRRFTRPTDHCQSHSFITDVTDVRKMEQGLLQLLDDFHSGKLQAFGHGNDITFEKMEEVREQQERLARLHFDLNNQQDIFGHDSDEGRIIAKNNMSKLIENLQNLSTSIEQLQSRSETKNFKESEMKKP